MSSFFDVLDKDFKNLAKLGYEIEKSIFTNPSLAIVNSRLFAEKLLQEVAKAEKQDYLISFSQFERIRNLNRDGILDDAITKSFDDIRFIGNQAVHEGKNNDIEYSVRLHKKLYSITKWFFEAYGLDYNVQVPLYTIPEYKPSNESFSLLEIDNIIKQRLEEFIDNTKKRKLVEEKGIERDLNKSKEELETEENIMKVLGYEYNDEILKEETKEVEETITISKCQGEEAKKQYSYVYKKLKGSYLLNELSKLSTSSQEAVESCDSLNAFKTYLHVKRSIQDELVELLQEANDSDEAQLILLCGSVGDGRSHLLAYVNEEYNEIVKNFTIHNDATESFDPSLTEIETLAKILEQFSDDNIDYSNEKLILAINLGVLNNFLEENFAKEKYKKFINFINESGVFNQGNISNGYKNSNFKLVSFGNYNIYELTKNAPESYYIEQLLKKIVTEDEGNPFYGAYLKDLEEKFNSPAIVNYKILSIPGVAKKIADLIISVMVKYKKLLGTRELLNFIYEIIVPADIEQFDMGSSSIDYLSSLLPNILFASKERGLLLKAISNDDVLKIRHEKIDELLINLNISTDIVAVLGNYLEQERIGMLEVILGDINNFNAVSDSVKQEIVDTIIRLLYLIGNEAISSVFKDSAYEKFMVYLYHFNNGQAREYKMLFDEVKEAVFNWNSSPKPKYIYLNERLKSFKVAEKLEIKPTKKVGICQTSDKEKLERFKNNINIAFETVPNGETEVLELDYQLYKKIVDINNGHYASKNDREEAVVFGEFVDKLLTHGHMESELLIEDKRDKKMFKLVYENDFEEEFIFERVDE